MKIYNSIFPQTFFKYFCVLRHFHPGFEGPEYMKTLSQTSKTTPMLQAYIYTLPYSGGKLLVYLLASAAHLTASTLGIIMPALHLMKLKVLTI